MRDHILSEITRLATENDGQPPGNQAFVTATGITESKWRGKIWARWGDALVDAGFSANEWTQKAHKGELIDGIIRACRHYKKFPTNSEIELLRQSDKSFPSPKVVQVNFENRNGLVKAIADFIAEKREFADVAAMLPALSSQKKLPKVGTKQPDGVVYLLKYGDAYKIGCGQDLEKRIKQVQVALPEKGTPMHHIKTDDPFGIEAYWHNRFKNVRANGEWFKLTPADVKAFMRRTFQ